MRASPASSHGAPLTRPHRTAPPTSRSRDTPSRFYDRHLLHLASGNTDLQPVGDPSRRNGFALREVSLAPRRTGHSDPVSGFREVMQ